MITSKNNFKGYLRRKYPNILAKPVYGLPVYILNHPLDDIDNYDYHLQQLNDGRYVVFIGTGIKEATELLQKFQSEGIPKVHTRERETAPTTFSCFESWLHRNNITAINRTFCANMSPVECFRSECIIACNAPHKKGTWYMYELPPYIDDGKKLDNIPHITIDDGTKRGDITICLIKASSSRYKSRKQRFIEKFQFMQPIYEQLIAACAKEEWDQAHNLCTQYMQTQFEREGTIDTEKMKEAYKNGTLGLFTRDIENLHQEDSSGFDMA